MNWCSGLLHYLSSCCWPETSRAVRCRPITGDFLPIKAGTKLLFEFSSVLKFDRSVRIVLLTAISSCGILSATEGVWIRSTDAGRLSPVAGTPIRLCTNLLCCCVRSWYVGTPIRRCTNLLCWTLESDTATCRSSVAGTPLRRCTNLLCWTLESDTATRRSLIRRLAGVPICCVERWNLIRRLAGRRYAASPVYQSVVLNVGIRYADCW